LWREDLRRWEGGGVRRDRRGGRRRRIGRVVKEW
jgi:hypothetical protein